MVVSLCGYRVSNFLLLPLFGRGTYLRAARSGCLMPLNALGNVAMEHLMAYRVAARS